MTDDAGAIFVSPDLDLMEVAPALPVQEPQEVPAAVILSQPADQAVTPPPSAAEPASAVVEAAPAVSLPKGIVEIEAQGPPARKTE